MEETCNDHSTHARLRHRRNLRQPPVWGEPARLPYRLPQERPRRRGRPARHRGLHAQEDALQQLRVTRLTSARRTRPRGAARAVDRDGIAATTILLGGVHGRNAMLTRVMTTAFIFAIV